jgi:hypothetical protein
MSLRKRFPRWLSCFVAFAILNICVAHAQDPTFTDLPKSSKSLTEPNEESAHGANEPGFLDCRAVTTRQLATASDAGAR